MKTEASPEQTRSFYALDMARRTRARIHGNLRVDLATEFILGHIRHDHRVLDIGCGIGIATERIAAVARNGHVYGMDISNDHIAYCRRTIKRDNASFHESDILADFESVAAILGAKVDVVTLVDVIEHLPPDQAAGLFSKLPTILVPGAQVLLTFPSPEYQKQLYEDPAARLQPVDLVLEVEDVQKLARRAGMSITSFSYVDVWQRNQYIHCVLSGNLSLERCSMMSRILGGPMPVRLLAIRHLAKKFQGWLARPWLKRRYG